MEVLERIKLLCKQHDISIYQLEDELEFGRNTIYQWKKRTPGIDKINAVANYFNVSVDYLLGRDGATFQLNKQEEDLLAAFRLDSKAMTDEQKDKFNESIKQMMKIAKNLVDEN